MRAQTLVDPRIAVATRELHGAAALLAASVLADSAIEHYRGSFQNKAMYLPLVAATLTMISSAHGVSARTTDSHMGRSLSYSAAIAVGTSGTAFHAYNIVKRVGGLRWENLFYGAPIGAPAALILSGLAGLAADRIAGNERRNGSASLFGLPAGRVVAALTSLGLIGTVGEAALMHFRGNFQNPAMYLPVTLPPLAAAVTAAVAVHPTKRNLIAARIWLGVTSLLGLLGVGFHCYGVSRAMGGWRNWRQNVIDGPPIPAPPSFSGLSLAGIAALTMIESLTK